MRRQPLLAFRRADERRRIAFDRPLRAQIPPEGPDRRELARRRRPRVAALVQIAEEARGCAGGRSRAGRSSRALPSEMRREEREELRRGRSRRRARCAPTRSRSAAGARESLRVLGLEQHDLHGRWALTRSAAVRLRRASLATPSSVEIRQRALGHRELARSFAHARPSCCARSAVSGGMMPNVMFVGW